MAAIRQVATCYRCEIRPLLRNLAYSHTQAQCLDSVDTGIGAFHISAGPGLVVTDTHTDRHD